MKREINSRAEHLCQICSKYFPDEESFHNHLTEELASVAPNTFTCPDYTCFLCKKTFKTEKGLNQHIGKLHTNKIKPYKCNYCSRAFKSKQLLKTHCEQVHFGSKKARCPFCFKVLYNIYRVKDHINKCLS